MNTRTNPTYVHLNLSACLPRLKAHVEEQPNLHTVSVISFETHRQGFVDCKPTDTIGLMKNLLHHISKVINKSKQRTTNTLESGAWMGNKSENAQHQYTEEHHD
jgi:hypothetical protein